MIKDKENSIITINTPIVIKKTAKLIITLLIDFLLIFNNFIVIFSYNGLSKLWDKLLACLLILSFVPVRQVLHYILKTYSRILLFLMVTYPQNLTQKM